MGSEMCIRDRPSWSNKSQLNRLTKSALGIALKKSKLAVSTEHIDYVTFKVDPKVDGAIIDVEPFERNF